MTRQNDLAITTEQVSLSSPNDVMKFATNLKDIIIQNKLYTNIKGKNYVNVEGWQIAGAFTGTFPLVEKVENIGQGNEYKYRAEVSIIDREGKKVGYGVAICTNKESGKKNFDEYAVASMAQTRAVGKAYRMQIGWLLKIAGYETTPAEEMSQVIDIKDENTPTFSREKIGVAKLRLGVAKDIVELRDIWDKLDDIKTCQEVIDYKNKMKEQIENG